MDVFGQRGSIQEILVINCISVDAINMTKIYVDVAFFQRFLNGTNVFLPNSVDFAIFIFPQACYMVVTYPRGFIVHSVMVYL